MNETSGFVYFVRAETGQTKIGWTRDPHIRLGQLQIGSPVDLTLVGLIAAKSAWDERSMHARFAHSWIRGEWFAWSMDLEAVILASPPEITSATVVAQRETRAAWRSVDELAEDFEVRRWQAEALLDGKIVPETVFDGQRGVLTKDFRDNFTRLLVSIPSSHKHAEAMIALAKAPPEMPTDSGCRCATKSPAPYEAPPHWLATCPELSNHERAIAARIYVQPKARIRLAAPSGRGGA